MISKLTYSFNKWFATHRVPQYLKTARVVTLSKGINNYPDFGDIRLIAVLPTLYKVYEQIILQLIR